MGHRKNNIVLAKTTDLVSVNSFYEEVGYREGCRQSDHILVAKDEQKIVGAVRLCEEGGTLVLRGMYVAEERCGKGLGSRLLEAASAAIGEVECWCVPYVHLVDFYSRIGFCELEGETVPTFLAERLARYCSNKQAVTIMRRSAQ